MSKEDNVLLENDGFVLSEVGPWAIDKHEMISYFSSLFAKSMKKKWDCRLYIDLYSGAGKYQIEGTDKIVLGSPLLALNINNPFDKYIFCEKDPAFLEALKARVQRYFPDRDCMFVEGDVNNSLDQLFSIIPKFSSKYSGLTLCLVDPYRTADLSFNTLETIAHTIFTDFLILIPSFMDINRNERYYISEDNHIVDNFLGSADWRIAWADPSRPPRAFGVFIAEQFCRRMEGIGYKNESLEDLELIEMGTRQNLPLYYLCAFSKNPLGQRFWKETKKGTSRQLKLW